MNFLFMVAPSYIYTQKTEWLVFAKFSGIVAVDINTFLSPTYKNYLTFFEPCKGLTSNSHPWPRWLVKNRLT